MPTTVNFLYINPKRSPDSVVALLASGGNQADCVADFREALDAVGSQSFTAVFIAEEASDSAAFDFISEVRRLQPDLLVFQVGVFRSEMEEILKLLDLIAKGNNARKQ